MTFIEETGTNSIFWSNGKILFCIHFEFEIVKIYAKYYNWKQLSKLKNAAPIAFFF